MRLRQAIAIGGLAFGAALGGASVALSEQPPPAPAPSAPKPSPLSTMSADFWSDWKTTQSSQSFADLQAAVGGTAPPVVPAAGCAAGGASNVQRIVDVAIAKPADAAKLLSAATTAPSAQVSPKALATVVTMTTSPKTREAAAALVAPEAKAEVETWNASLSTGIQGLPGIYLSDSPIETTRSAAPAGYAPVSGGSMGCSGK